MRILIITQKVDVDDPVLGFFHRWIEKISFKYEEVGVICLEKGKYSLPKNVKVFSLGKERGANRVGCVLAFYKLIWKLRGQYDAVFVHMNQEYVILGGLLWRLLKKKVYLWRNHAHGNILTVLAVFISDRVFYTSPQSFTAKYEKSVKMPVGIDTDFFKPNPNRERRSNSVLFLGRISPVKRVLEFVEWFNAMDESYIATIAGEPLPKDKVYYDKVRENTNERINFIGAVTQDEALKLYQTHELYVNKTLAGSMDKTIFEAAACETNVKVDNIDVKHMEKLEGEDLRNFVVTNHSMDKLMDMIKQEI